jgi:hypothetical protein
LEWYSNPHEDPQLCVRRQKRGKDLFSAISQVFEGGPCLTADTDAFEISFLGAPLKKIFNQGRLLLCPFFGY